MRIQIQIPLCRNTNIYLGDLYVEQQHAHSSQPILLYLGLRVEEGFPLGYQLFFQQTIVVTSTQLKTKIKIKIKMKIKMGRQLFVQQTIVFTSTQLKVVMNDKRSIMMQ